MLIEKWHSVLQLYFPLYCIQPGFVAPYMCMHINSYCAHTLLQNCNVYVHTLKHLKNIPQNIKRNLAVHLTNSIMFVITGTPHRPYGDSLSEVLKVEENMKLRWI